MVHVTGMNREEIKKFLSLPHIAKIATTKPDGSTQISPVWFHHDGTAIIFATYKESVKVRNIRQSPTVSVLIDSSNGGLKLKGILMRGTADLIDGEDCKKIEKIIYDKYLPTRITRTSRVAATFKKAVTSKGNSSSVCVRFRPTRITTWDYYKMTVKDVLNESGQAYATHRATEIFGSP